MKTIFALAILTAASLTATADPNVILETGCTTGETSTCTFTCPATSLAQISVSASGNSQAAGTLRCGDMTTSCDAIRTCAAVLPSPFHAIGSCELDAGQRATCGATTVADIT